MAMGNHTRLVNGRRGEDGAIAAAPVIQPLTVPLSLPRGPVSQWTAPEVRDETLTQEVATAVRQIDGDKVIRQLTAFVVLAVAAFAAVVSYSHIFDLGIHHGQSGTAARLLPLSVDGLIAAASLVMLHAARNRLPVPFLSRLMLALGVGATVAANVAYGLPFGWLSAVVSAWPAAAFVGSVEMAIRFVSDARHVATETTENSDTPSDITEPAAATEPAPEVRHDEPAKPVTEAAPPAASKRQPPARKTQSGADKVRAILTRSPELDKATVAKRAGVSVRTVERVMGAKETS